MFEGEIMFYNGFNLLVDIILILIAGFIGYYLAEGDAYTQGIEDGYNDALRDIEGERIYLSSNGDWIANYVPVLGSPESK